MHTRSKKIVATMAVVPVVASLGLSAAPSGAASSRQQTMSNGNFEHGRAGWAVGTARTNAAVVKLGAHGSMAMKLTNRRTGPAILNSRSNVARSAKAGQRYTVTALVRTNQPGLVGRLVLRETANGRAVKNTVKGFRAYRTWHSVTMNATARRAGTQLNVRFAVNRLKKRKALLIDNVAVFKLLGGSGAGTPAPTPLPDRIAGKLTNGCAYNARGIPGSCAAYLGSAYGGNADPTPWENTMTQQLGVRRTYYGASQVDKAVSIAKSDLAKRRLPWISFKLPYSWPDMVAGKGDAWVRDLSTKLSKLDGPVWLAFHHEPEGDGDIKQWTAMQARLAPIVRSIAPNVAYSIVVTGWNQFFGADQYKLDNIMPKNTKIDLLGIDVYQRYGAPTDGKIKTTFSNLDRDYFAPTSAWAKAHGMAWGVAETGYTDKAAEDDPTWLSTTYNQLKARGGVAFTYFNSNLNSTANWELGTAAKKSQYTAANRSKPTL